MPGRISLPNPSHRSKIILEYYSRSPEPLSLVLCYLLESVFVVLNNFDDCANPKHLQTISKNLEELLDTCFDEIGWLTRVLSGMISCLKRWAQIVLSLYHHSCTG